MFDKIPPLGNAGYSLCFPSPCVENLLTPGSYTQAMHWDGIDRQVKGLRIQGLRFEPEVGYALLELEDGRELWISADREGCQIILFRRHNSQTPIPRGVALKM